MTKPSSYLLPTTAVDSAHPAVVQQARRLTGDLEEPKLRARALFLFVRDAVAYTPFAPFSRLSDYRASLLLERGKGFCVQKAVLLAALCRAAGIPARLVFVDIKNHQASESLVALLGTNVFSFHAYVELLLAGRWVAATPAFDRALCERQGYPVVQFDGERDAVFPDRDAAGRPFITYEARRGTFEDVPVDKLLDTWRSVYGAERVQTWIDRSRSL